MRFLSVAAVCLVLAGCVGGSGSGGVANDYATACMFEVNPPGAYVWTDGDSEVKPGGDGTAEGAAQMNACIQRKLAAEGPQSTAGTTKAKSEVVTSAGKVTETETSGSPRPQKTAKAPAVEVTAQASYGGVPACSLTMVGGTGYACASD